MFKHGFPPEWSTFKKLIWLVGSGIAGAAAGVWKTVTGTLIHITDALASPMQKCEVTLEPVQAGSGDPSPDNVRPITGWTGCEVSVAGANIAPSSVPSNIIAGTFNAGDTKIYSAANARVFAFKVPKNAQLCVQKKSGSSSGHVIALGDTGEIAYNTPIYSAVGLTNVTEQIVSTGDHEWIYVQSVNLTGANDLFASDEFMVSVGSSRKTYEKSKGTNIYFVTFGDTVYGCKYDFVSGKLLAIWKCVEAQTLTWTAQTGSMEATISDRKYGTDIYPLSSHYKGDWIPGWQSLTDGMIGAISSYIIIRIKDDAHQASLADWNNYLTAQKTAGTPVQILYELAEPTEIQLTPQEISTLAGENNVWSNGDSVEITYKAQA